MYHEGREMKRILLIGLIMASMSLLIAVFAIPAFAHGPGGKTGSTDNGEWEAMYEACLSGDWGAMIEAAKEVHENYSGYMPCFGYNEGTGGYNEESQSPSSGWGEIGHHMGGGMMGWR
jgi:hypothetical protein